MSDYNPTTPRSIPEVRAELDKVAAAIQTVLHRDGTAPNQMEADLDMNGNSILNAVTDPNDPSSLVTKAYVDAGDAALDAAKVNRSGDVMTGNLSVPTPTQGDHAANADYVNAQIAGLEGAEGIVPLLAPRQQGDGVAVVFNSPATNQVPNNSLLVNIDGVTQRPFTDYTADAAGNVVFTSAPPLFSNIDVTLYEPANLQEAADFSQVTATGSTTPRTLADRFADVVNVRDFGAVGDGVTDDTLAIQNAIDSMQAGDTLTGKGLFTITTILPKQGTVIENMRFRSLGSTLQVSHIPMIRIGDNVNEFDGLLIDNVHLDGNRINYENIDLFAGADGGMHGFHIRGFARNITIRDSSAKFCGTAGLALDQDTNRDPSTDAPRYNISDINIVRCDFTDNREHGSFAAYCQRVKFLDCNMIKNGRDLDGGPWAEEHGGHGAYTMANGYFGRGLDIESYNVTSNYTKVEVRGGEYSQNANGAIQFFDPNTIAGNYIAPAHCVIENVLTGPATEAPVPEDSNTINIQCPNPVGSAYGMNSLFMTDITLQGSVRVNGVSGLVITGNQLGTTDPNRAIEVFNSRRVSTSIATSSEILLWDLEQNTPTLTVREGTSTPTLSLERYEQPVGGVSRATYKVQISGGGNYPDHNGFTFSWADGLPGQMSRNPSVYQMPSGAGVPIPSGQIERFRPIAYAADLDGVTNQDVYVDCTGTGNNFNFYVTVNVIAGREL